MNGSSFGDNVFFDHQRSHIVGPKSKASWPIFNPWVTQLLWMFGILSR